MRQYPPLSLHIERYPSGGSCECPRLQGKIGIETRRRGRFVGWRSWRENHSSDGCLRDLCGSLPRPSSPKFVADLGATLWIILQWSCTVFACTVSSKQQRSGRTILLSLFLWLGFSLPLGLILSQSVGLQQSQSAKWTVFFPVFACQNLQS